MVFMDKVKDRCGLFGIYNNDDFNTSHMIYYGLFSLQHRGVEAAGICVNDEGKFAYKRDSGMVTNVFDKISLDNIKGHSGIGHVLRYPGTDAVLNAQPIVLRYTQGHMAVAINGGLSNEEELRRDLEFKGAVFQTLEIAELISVLISRARNKVGTIEEAIADIMPMLKGGYAMLVMTPRKIIGVRDPLGIRPLTLGKKKNSWFLSSETCAFDELGVKPVRDVKPGEILVIHKEGLSSIETARDHKTALCAFEYIYHSRPDSVLCGQEVYQARFNMGKELAKTSKCHLDCVTWVPDSGLAAAEGYAKQFKAPLVDAFIKNRYFGRALINPEKEVGAEDINMKLSVIKSQVSGKRMAVVDDSMIRGTTARILVDSLKKAGAEEVHLRICSPLVKYACHYGSGEPEAETPFLVEKNAEALCREIGADSLEFLTKEGLLKACKPADCDFCTACFDGNYPV